MLKLLKRFRVLPLLLIAGLSLMVLAIAPQPVYAQTSPPTVPAPRSSAQGDTTIIPGQRVGGVTHQTTRQELARLYGEANLSDQEIAGAEGETQPGTMVNGGTQRSFTVVWANPSRTQAVAIVNLGSAWKTPEGIGVGTEFNMLQQQLGEFKLYGFAWDYGGTVVLEGTRLARYDGTLIMQLAPSERAMQRSPQQYRAVTGDELFSSSNPNFQPLEITVNDMSVYLSPTGTR